MASWASSFSQRLRKWSRCAETTLGSSGGLTVNMGDLGERVGGEEFGEFKIFGI